MRDRKSPEKILNFLVGEVLKRNKNVDPKMVREVLEKKLERKEETTMVILNQFKNFDTDRMDVDELVELIAFGQLLRDQYDKLGLEEPEFVGIQLKSLKREIKAKNADRLAARLREIKNLEKNLQTPAEKKAALLKERKQIEEQLEEVEA